MYSASTGESSFNFLAMSAKEILKAKGHNKRYDTVSGAIISVMSLYQVYIISVMSFYPGFTVSSASVIGVYYNKRNDTLSRVIINVVSL